MFQPNREELAWAAGFFDGEGCVLSSRVKQGAYPRIIVTQTGDHATFLLGRFNDATGNLGKIRYCGKPRENWSHRWDFQLDGHEKVQAVCAMLWSFLGPRKKEQFVSVLEQVKRWNGGSNLRSINMKRRWESSEYREKMKARFSGEGNPFFGKKLSSERYKEMQKKRAITLARKKEPRG